MRWCTCHVGESQQKSSCEAQPTRFIACSILSLLPIIWCVYHKLGLRTAIGAVGVPILCSHTEKMAPESPSTAGAAKVAMVAAGGSAKDIEKESAMARLLGSGVLSQAYTTRTGANSRKVAPALPNSSSSTPLTQSQNV